MIFDVVIIGAGVIGLAIAEALAEKNRHVAILEKNDAFGRETSSRNSEVIHAGIYYPGDFLKSRLCVAGNRLLYDWCKEKNVPHRRVGKLIVATTDEEVADLERIKVMAEGNGVEGLTLLGKTQIRTMEPEVSALAALFSPATGVIDAHALMRSLLHAAEEKGAVLACRAEVTAIRFDGAAYGLEINDGEYEVRTPILINSAGLYADEIAALAGLDIDARGYRLKFCKGNYFSASPVPKLHHLVYPVPVKNNVGLGIHATLDLAGRVRFGPDSRYLSDTPPPGERPLKNESFRHSGESRNPEHIENIGERAGVRGKTRFDYAVDEDHLDAFYESIRRYLPGIRREALFPDMSGIRPKLQGPGDPPADFVIAEESAAGFPGLINLIGMESPGLTASLAIGDLVRQIVTRE